MPLSNDEIFSIFNKEFDIRAAGLLENPEVIEEEEVAAGELCC
jgi:hypothetical protein